MYDHTKLVQEAVWQELLAVLPTPMQHHYGRPRVAKEALLCGILQVLANGVAWKKIADCGCSYVTCWRYLNELERRGKLKLVYEVLARQKTDISEGAIDTTTVTSFRFARMVGWDGKHKVNGTKVSLFTDRNGLPADVIMDKANRHDGTFVQNHVNHTNGRRRTVINMDMIYSNLGMRRQLRNKGITMNVQTRPDYYKRKRGPKFGFDKQKYQIRFYVERTNAWLKAFRRVRMRRDQHPAMFKAFVYLALIVILMR
jgi:transposase